MRKNKNTIGLSDNRDTETILEEMRKILIRTGQKLRKVAKDSNKTG